MAMFRPHMHNLLFHEGYQKALCDFADWVQKADGLRSSKIPIREISNIAWLFAKSPDTLMTWGDTATIAWETAVKKGKKIYTWKIIEEAK